jgi:hypothetical protein
VLYTPIDYNYTISVLVYRLKADGSRLVGAREVCSIPEEARDVQYVLFMDGRRRWNKIYHYCKEGKGTG